MTITKYIYVVTYIHILDKKKPHFLITFASLTLLDQLVDVFAALTPAEPFMRYTNPPKEYQANNFAISLPPPHTRTHTHPLPDMLTH